MATALDNAPVIQHQNLVGALEGEQPLGDDKSGAPLHKDSQRLLDQMLGFGIDAAGRIVQNQDARVTEQGAGDGKALFLPAAQGHAALTDDGLIAFGKGFDKVMGMGRFGGSNNRVHRRFGLAIGDVFSNGRVEEKGVLQNSADLAAQTLHL